MLQEKISSLPLPDFSKTKNVLLVGAGGLTGKFYSQLLLREGKKVFAYDHSSKKVKTDSNENLIWVNDKEFDSLAVLSFVDAITLSPGVPLEQKIFKRAFEKKIPIFSELEFSLTCLPNPIVAITGTDGKSTVTALLAHLFNGCRQTAIACGNFGVPFSALVLQNKKEVLIAELSSYQLELCRNLQAEVALFLNIAHDHLNRYPSFMDYCLTKWKLSVHVKKVNNFLINQNLMASKYSSAKQFLLDNSIDKNSFIQIDENKLSTNNFFWHEEVCYFKNNYLEAQKIIHKTELIMKGKHNQVNILFALQALYNFLQEQKKELPNNFVQNLFSSLKKFSPPAHRFELIAAKDKNIYINDSKATTTQAVITALENVTSPVYIFLGGQGKGESYKSLLKPLQQKEAKVILFGQAAQQMKMDLQDSIEIIGIEKNLQQAFNLAQKDCRQKKLLPPVTFLLAPAATSWDAFASFEERGDFFKNLVAQIKG